jgi:hypothetical protein
MVYDRLAAGKPLMITRPTDPLAAIDEHGYLSACEWLDAARAADVVAEVARVQGDAEATARLQLWVQRYFGDTTPGVATARFHAAIATLMADWETWHDRHLDDGAEGEEDEAEFDDDTEPVG